MENQRSQITFAQMPRFEQEYPEIVEDNYKGMVENEFTHQEYLEEREKLETYGD